MLKTYRNKKRVFYTLFLLLPLLSCSKPSHQWKLVKNIGSTEEYSSSRLYMPTENSFSGLELDILNTHQRQHVYINAFGLELQPENKTPDGLSTISLTVIANDQKYPFVGFLLKGGHRILLPDDASTLIISHLSNNTPIQIQIAHYTQSYAPWTATKGKNPLYTHPPGSINP